jgi:hypothetical protein
MPSAIDLRPVGLSLADARHPLPLGARAACPHLSLPIPNAFSLRGILYSVFLLFALPPSLPASTPAVPELSAPVSEKLGALRDLTDAKNYGAALALLEPLIAAAPQDSYDLAVLAQIKAQIILNQGGPTAPAVAPLETALRLGDAHGFLNPDQTLEVLHLLAQLHYEQAAAAREPKVRQTEYAAAAAAVRRWLDQAPNPGEDALLLAALIYYNQAAAGPQPPEPAALRTVAATAARGLTQTLQPKESLYLLLLATDQQLGQTAAAADMLELLVRRAPTNHDYWQQLAATYLALAAAAPDDGEARRLNLRALLTLERAQSHGALRAPADNFNMAGLTFRLGQPEHALGLLETGLRTGAITDDPALWDLLAMAGQQSHQEARALADLAGASAPHPDDGRINYARARLDYALDQHAAARGELETALARGHLDHPGQAALLLAYLDAEARQFDAAARWLDEAARAPDTPTDDLARLRDSLATNRPRNSP